MVVWDSLSQDGDYAGVFGQRYDSAGVPAGSEFLANTYTSSDQIRPAVAVADNGDFVVVWDSA